MKTLNADLKSGNLKSVYLLYGTENYLKRQYKKKFMQAFSGQGGMNCTVFEGKDSEEDAVIAAADTMPFFALRRLVVVEDGNFFKTSSEKLLSYLSSVPETAVLLFLESAVDKRSRLYKAVQKQGYVCELNHPDEDTLKNWAARYLAKSEKKITQSTMDRFLCCVGDDMENIQNELDKLISYLGEEEVVTIDAVDTLTSVSLTNHIFEMVSAITARRIKEAMRLYDDLRALKEPPMRILFLVARQYSQLMMVGELLAEGKTKGEISKLLRLPPAVIGKMAAQVRNLSLPSLRDKLRQCVELEEKIKTGGIQDGLAVEILICGE